MNSPLDTRLDSFDPAVRAAALAEASLSFSSFNMHCHSFFSYNGYGYSPSHLVKLGKERNWRAIGLVDFDVLDGVDEFLEAAKIMGMRAVAGMETRVFIPELADVEINSPGEPGVAYHLAVGFKSSGVPAAQRGFAQRLREQASNRTRQVVAAVNTQLSEIALDFDTVAKLYTPAGNVTERHVCRAYREKAAEKFSVDQVKGYWQTKIGGFDADPVKLEAMIRSKTMKKGGVGYQKPDPASFPTLDEMNKFALGCGAKPVVAWLNGLTAGESDPDQLLDLHVAYGAEGVTLIPDRNWRAADAEKSTRLVSALNRFVTAAKRRRLPLLAGTEMNAPGQLFADDFTVPELIEHLDCFTAGADSFVK